MLSTAVFLATLVAAAPTDSVHSGRAGQIRVTPPRIESGITIDGSLDEPEWRRAARLTGFSQFAPTDGRAAEDSTEVLVWYSPTAIHFGIRAFERHGSVNATLADRDRIAGDDHIEILLGTFNDGRQATMIAVNPFGVQADGIVVETGGGGSSFMSERRVREPADLSPDLVFESKGRLTDYGYEIEVRVPFKSLRYSPAAEQAWGLHIVRHVQHSGHEESWVPARRAAASFLGQAGTLTGLRDLRRGVVLDVTPEVTASVAGSPDGDGWQYADADPELGATVRWGITNNLTLNGTVNPDFSQVEADAGQFTFDPRSALFFPEKRPFFLDGIEQFATPNSLIYSRRIVQPVVAAKLTGKMSGTDVAALAAVDDRLTNDGDHPVHAIVRVQRDLGASSRIGFALTDREQGGNYNRVAGIDSRLVFGGVYAAMLQVAGSQTRTGGVTTTAPLWSASLTRNGRTFSARYRINAIDEDFEAQSGFISRPGIVNATASHTLTAYGSRGAVLERSSAELVLDGTWQYDEFMDGQASQDRKLHLNLGGTLRGGWSAGGSVLIESFGYDPRLYEAYAIEAPAAGGGLDTLPFVGTPRLKNLDWIVRFSTPQWTRFSGSAFVLWGVDENFFEWSSAEIYFATLTARWRPTDRIRVEGTYRHLQYDRDSDETTVGMRRIPRLKVEYQVARPLFVRVVGEYDASEQDALRDDSRTNHPILIRDASGVYRRALATSRNRLRGDVLLSYQPTPGTVFFLGYGSTSVEPRPLRFSGLERTRDGFFVKASYLIRR